MKSLVLTLSILGGLSSAAWAAPIAPTSVSSDYARVDITTPNGCWAPSTYAVGPAVGVCHDLWVTPEPGQWAFMNGDDESPDQVAYRLVYEGLSTFTDYSFTSVVANVCCNFNSGFVGPLLTWYLNGVSWMEIQTDGPGVAETFSRLVNTGAGSSLVFELRNQRGAWNGNDFALNTDRTALSSDPVPEPASFFMLGSGLLGLGAAVRRRRAERKA
ncbi:MAG TPA: PEP-CTERM sorting domain-containing protein [Sedimentisphaerales bacterium]|nr:PEP-CTERM sorting domain-containing protein [Sedimentisphaerales bacterium]